MGLTTALIELATWGVSLFFAGSWAHSFWKDNKPKGAVTFTDPETKESVTVSTEGKVEDVKKFTDFIHRVDRKQAA